ncbi:MAG: HEAT repeat domain-containing protein [Actinomycetota bacterium]
MVLELITAVEQADSADRLLRAVQALAAARDEAAIPTLMKVLSYNNPGAAIAAVEGLVSLGTVAVEALLQLDSYNYGARAWAIRALAAIGDPRGLKILLDAATNDFALSVRRAATRGLGTIRWHELPTTEVAHTQLQTWQTLFTASQDPEWVVRYAAVVAIQGLLAEVVATPPDWFSAGMARLEEIVVTDRVLAVQARALLAKQSLQEQQLVICS